MCCAAWLWIRLAPLFQVHRFCWELPDGTVLARTLTDKQGSFSLLESSPGEVTLVVPAYLAFAESSVALHVVGALSGLRVVLRLREVTQEITVAAGQALSAEASANQDAVAVTSEELVKVPVFDQDPVATLTPFLDSASASSGGITLILDGVEVHSLGISASVIQEIRINGDPYSAEFNRPDHRTSAVNLT